MIGELALAGSNRPGVSAPGRSLFLGHTLGQIQLPAARVVS